MKVLFVYLHGIGDCIMFTPAIRMYKEKYPERKIGILCLPLTESFWKSCPLIDEVFVSYRKDPLHHGLLPLYLLERMKLQKIIKKIKRDHGYDKVEYIVPHSFKFLGMSIPIPGVIRRLLTITFETHEVLKLCKRLNLGQGKHWPMDFKQEITLTKQHKTEGAIWQNALKGKKPMCIIHVTASSKNKSLTNQEKQSLIEMLSQKYTVILLQEKSQDPRVKTLITNDVMVSAAVIAKAKLFIGIDSGPAHIAEVLDIPRVIITKTFRSELLFIPSKNALLLDSFDIRLIKQFAYDNHRKAFQSARRPNEL